MSKRRGECLHETSSYMDAFAKNQAVCASYDRTSIRACTLPEGGRGWRVWGYAA